MGAPRMMVKKTHLDEPCPLAQTVKTKFVRNLRSIHCVGQILLIRKDKEKRITELVLVEHSL